MTSYFSSITSSSTISNISTRFSSLRRALVSGNEADDPDFEDSSHISNVLRAYYTEKGRRWPEWLPPDPKNPQNVPVPTVAVQSAAPGGYGGYGGRPAAGPAGGRGGGLSDLWDSSPASASSPNLTTASLRRGGRQPLGGPTHSPRPSTGRTMSPGPPAGVNPGFVDDYQASQSQSARPLPSQRAGSYQTARPGIERGSGSSGASASDRLRARLQGRTGSPSPASGGQQPYVAAGRPWESGDQAAAANAGQGGNFDGGYEYRRQPPGGGLPGNPRPRGPR